MEKRKHRRYTKRLETKVYAGDSELRAITSDVSEGGIFIRTQRGFSPGSIVEIDIYLPDNKSCRIRGKVKRTVKTPLPIMKNGMGIEIMDISKDSCYSKFFEILFGEKE